MAMGTHHRVAMRERRFGVAALAAAATLTLAACGLEPGAREAVDPEALTGEEDRNVVCYALGLPATCDPCEALGLYADQRCQVDLVAAGLCCGPDPGCAGSARGPWLAAGGSTGPRADPEAVSWP